MGGYSAPVASRPSVTAPASVRAAARIMPSLTDRAPETIAPMYVFLASDESSFSTGAEFVADGGEVPDYERAETISPDELLEYARSVDGWVRRRSTAAASRSGRRRALSRTR